MQCLPGPLGGLLGVVVEQDKPKEFNARRWSTGRVNAWITACCFGQRYTPDEISGNAIDFTPRSPATASEF